MATTQISARMAELAGSRVPFVHATVVRAQEPSSARAGDQAIVFRDGSIEGFIGGHCAAGSVRSAAMEVLDSGLSVLLRVLPDAEAAFPESPGASIVVNPCLSGGAMEIYLEPLLPSPALYVVGTSPTAEAVAALAPSLGFAVERAIDGAAPDGALAAIVSSQGGDEAGFVRRALDAGVGFVGVVCSKTRGRLLLAELDLSESERQRVHVHVGVDIGAKTAPEIALSVLAAVVRSVRLEGLTAPADGAVVSRDDPAGLTPGGAAAAPRGSSSPPPDQVLDPVCGMAVTVVPDTPHARVAGHDVWFCGPGCRDSYVQTHTV